MHVPATREPDRPHVIMWSANTQDAASRRAHRLAAHFASGAAFLPSVATLHRKRTPKRCRGAVVAADGTEAAALLRSPTEHLTAAVAGAASRVVFLFPGATGLRAGVGRELHAWSPAFAGAFDECVDLFEAAGVPLRSSWLTGDEDRLGSLDVALPLSFALERALASAWRSWGVAPSAVVGHGLGELAAATEAGALDLEDAVRAVIARSEALERTPPQLPLTEPRIGLYSAAAGGQVGAEVTAPERWSRQLEEPVRLADAISALATEVGRHVLIEVGPGRALTVALRQHPSVLSGQCRPVATLERRETGSEVRSALTAIARVWVEGHDVDWTAVDDLTGADQALQPDRPDEPAPDAAGPTAPQPVSQQPTPSPAPSLAGAAAAASVAAVTTMPAPSPVIPAPSPAPAAPAVPAARALRVSAIDRLRTLWTELLDLDDIAPNDDFFDLGGDSLAAVELVERVSVELGVSLRIVDLFDHPTLADLAALVDEEAA